jgi:hypothetical protein
VIRSKFMLSPSLRYCHISTATAVGHTTAAAAPSAMVCRDY